MVHIGMILIQGERTFIIFFFSNVYSLCFVSASRSEKKKKTKQNNLDGEGYEAEKFLYERSKSD